MPTTEEILQYAHEAARRISDINDQPYGGPVCAHLSVGYVRQHLGSGRERGWWQCTECEQKFIPSGTTPAGH